MRGLRFAVIGDPIAHTKSPAMHAAAYRALRMPHSYEAIRATDADLPRIVQMLRDGELAGVNVTVPHKKAVLAHVDAIGWSARAVQAANTLYPQYEDTAGTDRRIEVWAANTDVPALADELKALAPKRSPDAWTKSAAIVLGSGGAARAARAALESLGVADVIVRARSGFDPLAPTARDRDARTVIQATSAGMHGADPGDAIAGAIDWRALPDDAIALDVVYSPPETPFLRAARDRGLRAANGLGMLARQGALAFKLWLGVDPPLDVMMDAIR